MNALAPIVREAPAVVQALPTVARHRAALSPMPTYREDKDGNAIEGVDWTVRVDRYTQLIAPAEAQAVVSEVEASLGPAGRDTATKLARTLVGSYPAREVNDADIYARAIASVFETVPPDIGKAAVDHITRRLRFLPTRADVHEVCERMVAERRFAKRVAEAHLAEHQRRREARAEAEKRDAERKAFRAEWGDAWDAWMSMPLFGRPPFEDWKRLWTETPPERRADLTKPKPEQTPEQTEEDAPA